MTIKEKIEIIKRMKENRMAVAKYCDKSGNGRLYHENIAEAFALSSVIRILENDEYAKEIAETYKD